MCIRDRLGDVFSTVAFSYDVRKAIEDGWLCPIRSFLVQTQADFSQARKVAGELSTRDVEDVLTRELHLAEVVTPILRERDGRPTIVFAASVAHAHALCRVFNEQAGAQEFAAALDGSSPFDVRAPVLDRFKRGEIQVLVNCSLFTEGFDVPQIALVAIARPVLSRSFYAQMVGRGTRLSDGKRDLLVLDFVPGNCRHSLAQAVDIFASVDEEVRDRARRIAKETSEEGQAIALEKALELAQQEQEAHEATVSYQLRERDPFQAVGIDVDYYVRRSRGGARATDKQRSYLEKAGLPLERVEQLSDRQAEAIQERLRERKAVGLCSPKLAQKVCALGVGVDAVHADGRVVADAHVAVELVRLVVDDAHAPQQVFAEHDLALALGRRAVHTGRDQHRARLVRHPSGVELLQDGGDQQLVGHWPRDVAHRDADRARPLARGHLAQRGRPDRLLQRVAHRGRRRARARDLRSAQHDRVLRQAQRCLLYTYPSPRDRG